MMRYIRHFLFPQSLCVACQKKPKASKCLCRPCHVQLQQFLAARRASQKSPLIGTL